MHIKIVHGNFHHRHTLLDFKLFADGQFDEAVEENTTTSHNESKNDNINSDEILEKDSVKMTEVKDAVSDEVLGPKSAPEVPGIEKVKNNISQPLKSKTFEKKYDIGKEEKKGKKGVSLHMKRFREDDEECDSQWNVLFLSGGGGARAKTRIKYAEDEALDGMLQRHTTKSTIPKILDLTMCKNMAPGNFPLAKWPIKDYAKELKQMKSLKEFSLTYSPNVKGIVHPYVNFSTVKIPANEFDEYVDKEFFSCDLPSKGFLKFASSVGISKLQVLLNGEAIVVLTFSPKGWNKCGHRLGSGHCRKPEINPCKCDLDCCRGKWSDEEWFTVLNQFPKSK